MSSPTFPSDFRIIQRFPVLRGARATASKASVLCEPDAVAAPDTEPIESNHSKRNPPDFQRNVVSGGTKKMPHLSVSTAVHRIRSPSRQSFDGMPEQLVYGLFESHKNVRYVIPKIWSPTNPRQVGNFKYDVLHGHTLALLAQMLFPNLFNESWHHLFFGVTLLAHPATIQRLLYPHIRSLGSFALFLQAKTAIQRQNCTLAPTPYSELDHYRREEKERSIRARLHGSFRFKDEGRTWPHDSLSRCERAMLWFPNNADSH
jgi:hypothetical protein